MTRTRWVFCFLLCLLTTRAAGQAPPAAPADAIAPPAPLEFRRLYAPVDRALDWPKDPGAEYLPVDPTEFERLVEATQVDRRGGLAARIVAAHYHARLLGDTLVDGEALLDVTANARGATLLNLEPCGLAILDAQWEGEDPSAATIGLDPRGRTCVLVEKAGRLRLQWSLKGRRESNEVVAFDLKLPPCPATSLVLDLPTSLVVQATKGAAIEAGPTELGERRWNVFLGGHNRMNLRLGPAPSIDRPGGLTLLRQSMTYEISESGLELEVRLELDVHHEPLDQLQIVVEQGLRVVGARQGQSELPFAVDDDPVSGQQRLTVQFPEPIQGVGRVIQLAALGPVTLEQRWRLPTLRPRGAFWQEGKITLLVPSPLALEGLFANGCRQSMSNKLPTPAGGRSVELQCFAPDAGVEVVIGRPLPRLLVSRATTINLSASATTGQVGAHFHLAHGEKFSIEAKVSPHWTIDSVESVPPEDIIDWYLDAAHGLSVQLGKAIAPAHPLRVKITGRRLKSPVGEKLGRVDLQVLAFGDAQDEVHLINVRETGRYRIEVSGVKTLDRLDPTRLTRAESELFFQAPRGLLFKADKASRGLGVSLVRQAGPLASSSPAALSTAPPASVAPSSILAWECRLESRFDAGGEVLHRATWMLEHFGGGRISLAPPSSATIQHVWLDGRPARWRLTKDQAVVVDLPLERRFSTVGLDFVTKESTRFGLSTLEAPWPRADCQVLASTWTLWMPPACQILPGGMSWDGANRHSARWNERLFGPLARQSQSNWLDPIAAPWLSLSETNRRATAQREGLKFIQRLGAASLRKSSGRRAMPRWRTLLEQAAADAGGRGIPLLVDAAALRLTGIRADRAPDAPLGETAEACGVDLLEASNLALLIHPNALVLTSSAEAALRHEQLQAWLGAAALRVLPGDLDDALRGTARPGMGERFMPVTKWTSVAASPWHIDGSVGSPAADHLGWTAYRCHGGKQQTLRVHIVRGSLLSVAGGAVFLMVLAIGWPRSSSGLAPIIGTAGAFTVAVLLAPVEYLPLVQGGLWGSMACLAIILLLPRGVRQHEPLGRSTRGASSTAAIVGCLGWTAVLWAYFSSAARAAENPPAARPENSVHTVIIPVDDPRDPSPARYYLAPRAFYEELQRRAAAVTSRPQGWLLERAAYQADLEWDAQRKLAISEIKAIYDLHVFGQTRRVRLAIGHKEIDGRANQAFLDGIATPVTWEEDGDVMEIEVRGPGPCRVEVVLRPDVTGAKGVSGFSLPLPRVARSTLQVTTPADAPAIEVPSALGQSSLSEDGQRTVVDLGPIDRLDVKWPDALASQGAAGIVNVDELLWLKVQPGAVVLDARFKLAISQGSVNAIQLVADPRLRLLPASDDRVLASLVRTEPGEPQIIELEFQQPQTGQVQIDLTLLLTGSSGVGNLRLPRLEMLGARSAKRAFAISIDEAALEYREQGAARLEQLSIPDFAALWGDPAASPRLAYRVPGGENAWSLATQARGPRIACNQVLSISLGPGRATVAFEATLATSAGLNFQHRIQTPPGFEIEDLSLGAEGVEKQVRWSRETDGTVTVFLSEPAAESQQLSIRGHLPVESPQALPLPEFSVMDADLQKAEVRIFRRPGVLVELLDKRNLREIDEPLTPSPPHALGRLVRQFMADGADYGVTISVAPNRWAARSTQVTTMKPKDKGGWSAEMRLDLDVERGLIDDLLFSIPLSWTGPFEVEPRCEVQVAEGPDQEKRYLSIRPSLAIKDRLTLTVTGSLSIAAKVEAPPIRALNLPGATRWYVLPTQVGLESITWDTKGLRAAELPVDLAPALPPGSYQAYRIGRDPAGAVLRPAKPDSRQPLVRLADHRLNWWLDGTFLARSTFDVDPAGSSRLSLKMPQGSRLIAVHVAGRPVTPVSAAPTRWRLNLSASGLLQKVDVIYTGKAPLSVTSSQVHQWAAPQIGDLPATRTLWTVAGPEHAGVVDPDAMRRETARGESPRFLPHPTGESRRDLLVRAALAVFIGVACALLLILLHRRGMPRPSEGWLPLVGIASGIFWSLFLAPAFIGWAIFAISLAPLFRRAASMREASSSVVRIGTAP